MIPSVAKRDFSATTRYEIYRNMVTAPPDISEVIKINLLSDRWAIRMISAGRHNAVTAGRSRSFFQARIRPERSCTLRPRRGVSHLSSVAFAPTILFKEKSEVARCRAMMLAQ